MSVTSGWGRINLGPITNGMVQQLLKTGWGAQAWSDGEWNELKDVTITSNRFINYI